MKNVPEIRFKGFIDAWEQLKLGDIASLQRGFDLTKSDIKDGEYPVVMSSGVNGYHSEYKAKAPGVVTGRTGTIGNLYYIEVDYWPHNTTLWVADFKNNDPKFIYYLFNKFDFSRFGNYIIVPKLNRNNVHNEEVFVPCVAEQCRISDFLNTLDKTISLHKRKLDGLRELKAGYMQQMFPQAGESAPRVRFDGFMGNWVECPLNDLVTLAAREVPKPEMAYTCIIDKSDVNFIKHYISLEKFRYQLDLISPSITGRNMVLNKKNFMNIMLPLPKTIEEQAAIGDFFRNLDEQITNQQAKLEKLKQLKAAYLQRMFI
jgi:restriction endonuclease S subunit